MSSQFKSGSENKLAEFRERAKSWPHWVKSGTYVILILIAIQLAVGLFDFPPQIKAHWTGTLLYGLMGLGIITAMIAVVIYQYASMKGKEPSPVLPRVYATGLILGIGSVLGLFLMILFA